MLRDHIGKSLYSVEGGHPITGNEIMELNEDKELTAEILTLAWELGEFGEVNSYNCAGITLVHKADAEEN